MAGVVAPNAGKEVHTAWSDWYRGPPGQARYMPSLPVLRSARGLEDFVLQGWTASPNPSPNPNPNPSPNPHPHPYPSPLTPNPDPNPISPVHLQFGLGSVAELGGGAEEEP